MRVALVSSLVFVLSCGDVVKSSPDAEVDPCAQATCECTTATEVADCGAHAACNVAGPGRTCECVAAYAKTGGACTFAGAPANPGMSDATKWLAVGAGATIDPAAAGNVDMGEAVFDESGMCTLAYLHQVFTMPPLDRAEPFKLVVTHTAVDPQFDLGNQISIGVGKQWADLPISRNVYRTDSFCLGAESYGGPIDFRVATLGSPFCGSPTTAKIRIDQVSVRVADPGECPTPGSVVNGNFEAGTGWTFANTQGSAAAITAGAGEGGTAGGRIIGTNKCSEATMTGTIALPSRAVNANPAIDIFWTGTSGQRLVVGLSGNKVQTIVATAAGAHTRMCVPAWATGTTTSLSFFMQRQSDNGCATALARTFSIDNISVVNEPACNAPVDITDAGFERVANVTGPATGWGLTNAYVNDVEGVTTNAINSSSLAHGGNGVLRMTWVNQCTSINGGGADFTVTVPASASGAGPAIRFFSSSPAANTQTQTRLSILPAPNTVSPWAINTPETGAYVQSTLCLPPQFSGRPVHLRASIGGNGGSCIPVQPLETALFDDFEVTTDVTCPAQ